MNSYYRFSAIFVIAIILLINLACDEINPPYRKDNTNTNTDTARFTQKVVLEDFTGHLCVNCPDAHKIAKNLIDLYKGKVIVLAEHVGEDFASPTKDHPYDFRSPVGNDIGKFFKSDIAALPVGMVNRKTFGSTKLLQRAEWEKEVTKLIGKTAPLAIDLNANYDEVNKEISVTVDIEYGSDGSSEHNLCVLISEDSIVSYQKGRPQEVYDYVHNHVLRAAVNSSWGEQLKNGVILKGEKFKKEYKFKIPAANSTPGELYYWRPEKLHIVAFVHEYQGSYEILQAAEKKLIE